MSIIVHREKNPVFITHNIDLNYVPQHPLLLNKNNNENEESNETPEITIYKQMYIGEEYRFDNAEEGLDELLLKGGVKLFSKMLLYGIAGVAKVLGKEIKKSTLWTVDCTYTHLENEFSKYKTYLKTYIHGFKINLVDPSPTGINDPMKEYLKLEPTFATEYAKKDSSFRKLNVGKPLARAIDAAKKKIDRIKFKDIYNEAHTDAISNMQDYHDNILGFFKKINEKWNFGNWKTNKKKLEFIPTNNCPDIFVLREFATTNQTKIGPDLEELDKTQTLLEAAKEDRESEASKVADIEESIRLNTIDNIKKYITTLKKKLTTLNAEDFNNTESSQVILDILNTDPNSKDLCSYTKQLMADEIFDLKFSLIMAQTDYIYILIKILRWRWAKLTTEQEKTEQENTFGKYAPSSWTIRLKGGNGFFDKWQRNRKIEITKKQNQNQNWYNDQKYEKLFAEYKKCYNAFILFSNENAKVNELNLEEDASHNDWVKTQIINSGNTLTHAKIEFRKSWHTKFNDSLRVKVETILGKITGNISSLSYEKILSSALRTKIEKEIANEFIPRKWDEVNNKYIPITTLLELIEWNAFMKHYHTHDSNTLQVKTWVAKKLGDLGGCEVDYMNTGDWAYFNKRLVVPSGSWTAKSGKTVRYGHFHLLSCMEI